MEEIVNLNVLITSDQLIPVVTNHFSTFKSRKISCLVEKSVRQKIYRELNTIM